jgi:hypothetical protein
LHSLLCLLVNIFLDPKWIEADSEAALVCLSLVTLIILCVYAWDTHSLAKSSKLSAEAAVKSADAALAQVRAMIDKERARVRVLPINDAFAVIPFQGAVEPNGSRLFRFLNIGPTPATNVSVRYRSVITEFATEAVGELIAHAYIDDVIPANNEAKAELHFQSALERRVPTASFLHVWGEAMYKDVISDELHTTRFRFRMEFRFDRNAAKPHGPWQRCGPEEDNQAD